MPNNVRPQDVQTLKSCEDFLNELALREKLLWSQSHGETSMDYYSWKIRLEDTIAQIARFRVELEHRLGEAVAERLSQAPLPPGDVENPDNASNNYFGGYLNP